MKWLIKTKIGVDSQVVAVQAKVDKVVKTLAGAEVKVVAAAATAVTVVVAAVVNKVEEERAVVAENSLPAIDNEVGDITGFANLISLLVNDFDLGIVLASTHR